MNNYATKNTPGIYSLLLNRWIPVARTYRRDVADVGAGNEREKEEGGIIYCVLRETSDIFNSLMLIRGMRDGSRPRFTASLPRRFYGRVINFHVEKPREHPRPECSAALSGGGSGSTMWSMARVRCFERAIRSRSRGPRSPVPFLNDRLS